MLTAPPQYKHQEYTVEFIKTHPRVLDLSDPGVGKTRPVIDAFYERRLNGGGKMLAIAPKSILQPAWGDDIEKFSPNCRYVIATATNRAKAFEIDADIYITNHDAVRWLLKHPEVLEGFDTVAIDESTAFKNPQSQRSKAIRSLIDLFEYRECMTGTPNSNGILNIWHQAFLIDNGERLGTNYYQFRASVCAPEQVGPGRDMIKWVDKPGAEEAVAALLADITVRHKFEECHDIPRNKVSDIYINLNPKHRKMYEQLKEDAILELQDAQVSAVHAGVLTNKLLQLTSGAVYNTDGGASLIDTDRYELIIDLVEQRESCLVAFNWTHQRDQLMDLATKRGISFAVIDGSVKDADRIKAVNDFQNGLIKVIFAHPASAAHGLTLTKGTTTIWSSAVYDAEKFEQFNRRIYRAGQTRKTETILITARDTIEEQVFEKMKSKHHKMITLLDLLQIPTEEAA